MRILILCAFISILTSCKKAPEALSASQIVDKAIATQCVTNCDAVVIAFDFRDKQYISKRNHGNYSLQRRFTDSTGVIIDEVTNNGFKRKINEKLVSVVDTMALKYSDAVNSVHYFAQLPYGLNALAVNKNLAGETIIKEEPYYKIKVTFQQEGGGTDFEDEFMYWIHKENFTVDYLAYNYATNGGGIRFREAYNARVVNGIRFVDYNNYKPESLEISLSELAPLFETGALKLLSKIETENIKVTPL